MRSSSWLPAHPRRSRACPALSKALSHPQEKRLAGQARGWLWGDGSCQPSSPSTAPRPEVSAAAHHLWHTRNVLLLPARPPLLWDGHPDLLRGRGCRCRNPQGIMRDLHTCDWHCWILLPGHFQILRGFCPDWPEPCQGRAPWLTQTLQEATGKETSSTSSPPQPPTQLHLALGPKRGAGPACPCAAGKLSTALGDHPNSITKGPPAPDQIGRAHV